MWQVRRIEYIYVYILHILYIYICTCVYVCKYIHIHIYTEIYINICTNFYVSRSADVFLWCVTVGGGEGGGSQTVREHHHPHVSRLSGNSTSHSKQKFKKPCRWVQIASKRREFLLKTQCLAAEKLLQSWVFSWTLSRA